MILDEAQAIKSSSRSVGVVRGCGFILCRSFSVRWKLLMSFNCRNRLLLTGTPIQNTMAEVCHLSILLFIYLFIYLYLSIISIYISIALGITTLYYANNV